MALIFWGSVSSFAEHSAKEKRSDDGQSGDHARRESYPRPHKKVSGAIRDENPKTLVYQKQEESAPELINESEGQDVSLWT